MPSLPIRQAFRALRRAPGFVATATLTLGLGIGLSTAVFTVADALLLRRLPVRDQDGLVALWPAKRDGSADHWAVGIQQVAEFSRSTRALSAVAYADYYGATPIPVSDGTNITRLRRALVSGNLFGVVGAQAGLGRTIEPSDDVPGAPPVAVISHAAWTRDFGADPRVVGRRITTVLDGVTYDIVGVMPAGLEYPTGADFWAAYAPVRLRTAADSGYSALDIVARLAPGATSSDAQADLTAYLSHPGASVWSRSLRGTAQPFATVVRGDVRPAILAFIGAAALLLLITCIDVANLLLVRALARAREMAVRAALGGSRSRLLSQLLTENALLAAGGAMLGVAIAALAVRGFTAFAPAQLPLVGTIHLGGGALVATIATSAAAMLAFGVLPAMTGARADVHAALRSGPRHSGSRSSRVAREGLVAAQVTLAVMVLSAAALLGRSLERLQHVDLAFDASHLLIAELGMREGQYANLDEQVGALQRVLDRVAAVPGVEAVTPVVAVPYSGTGGWSGRAGVDGQSPQEAAANPMFNMELVTPDYFRTFDVPVLRGRALSSADVRGAEPVVVVSEGTARAYWPNQDPIGRHLRIGGQLDQVFTVVGVVPDVRYRTLRDARSSVYYPLAQSIFPFPPMTIAVRTSGDPARLVPSVRAAIAASAAGVVMQGAAPFAAYLRGPLAQPRMTAYLLGVFAFAAAALAAIGLFGVMSAIVRQRGRELGIRMALGATRARITRMVVGRGLAIAAVGTILGTAGAVAANGLLSSLLYDVSPGDPATLAGVGVFLLAVALGASLLPARVGARIDPAISLRLDD